MGTKRAAAAGMGGAGGTGGAATKPRAAPAPSAQAASHARTRKAHASELAEDYAEIITDLIDSTGEARVVDIAHRLGVSHVTVIRTLARLQKTGLVTTRPYRSVFLTDGGRRLGEHARRRHKIVLNFLLGLDISPAVAHADAEGIEHHVSPQTLAAFEKFTSLSPAPPRRG